MKTLNLKPNPYPGKLIIFEGADGAGKTTLLNKAKEFLNEKHIDFISLRMPSDERIRNTTLFKDYHFNPNTDIREKISMLALTTWISGDRLLQQDEIVIPALKSGKIVLCDRYCFTANAHCEHPIICKISEQFIQPDLAIMATAPANTVKQRVKNRIEEMHNFYDENLVNLELKNYYKIALKQNMTIIDTEQTQKQINEQLVNSIQAIL